MTEPAGCMCNAISVGDIASIIAGLAALAGLWFAGVEIRESRSQREAEAVQRAKDEKVYRASMARAVGMGLKDEGASAGRHTFSVIVRNGSQFPVERVEVVAANSPMDNPYEGPDELVTRFGMGTLFPESHKAHAFDWPDGLADDAQPDVDLTFVDTWGQRWLKTWNGPLVAYGEPEIPFPSTDQELP